MIDVHLRPPDDADLPSARTQRWVGAAVVTAWLCVGVLAVFQRSQEAESARAARTVDAATLTAAPPARFPGGVDKRGLDASGPLKHTQAPGPVLPPPPTHPPPPRGPGPHHPPHRPQR